MNWIKEFVKPRIKAFVKSDDQADIPDDMWHKCPISGDMVFHRDLENNHWVFPSGHHMRLPAINRLTMLFDDGVYEQIAIPETPVDPLQFKDLKKYADRLKTARGKDNTRDAIKIGIGKIGGVKAVITAFDFSFMGGSMGTTVGEAFVKAATHAIDHRAAFIVVPSSGGARMQEGVLSLMQLPRTVIAVGRVKQANLPYIVILTDPTTGGVTASFAMLGDIHIAEKGATIGFAGKRVIEQTVREKLPDDFQTSEYLRDHGMVDLVVPRHKLKESVSNILSYTYHS